MQNLHRRRNWNLSGRRNDPGTDRHSSWLILHDGCRIYGCGTRRTGLSPCPATVWFFAVLFVSQRKSRASTEANEHFLPKPVYFFGGAVGAVCASIVFFTTVLSKTVSIIILNTVPNAICLVGCLLIDTFLFRAKLNTRQMIGAVLNVLATTVIVLL